MRHADHGDRLPYEEVMNGYPGTGARPEILLIMDGRRSCICVIAGMYCESIALDRLLCVFEGLQAC